ncbi:MAG: hypothetical protein ABSG51_12290, partial [Terracidiphilus sp.]
MAHFKLPGGKLLVAIAVWALGAMTARAASAQLTDAGAQLAAITLMQQQIGLDNDAPNQRNLKGLRIQFEKISDLQQPDGHVVRYRMLAPGAPEGQNYVLEVWRIGTQVQLTPQPVYTNAKGLV